MRIGAVEMGEQLTEQRVMRVLIVDDDPLFRLGVAAALAGDEQLEFILSEAGDGEAALALVASEEPAVVVPDEHHALAASEGWIHLPEAPAAVAVPSRLGSNGWLGGQRKVRWMLLFKPAA
jgi:chemotaxis response regulator CheB